MVVSGSPQWPRACMGLHKWELAGAAHVLCASFAWMCSSHLASFLLVRILMKEKWQNGGG